MLRTRCPRCRTLVTARDLGACPDFPFCSNKCRMADLDKWFTEEYVVGENAGHERPFFLWTHFFDAHTPYVAGPWAQEQFRQLDYKGPLREGASVEQFYSLGENGPLTKEETRALRSLYDEEAVLLDGYFGQLLEALERRRGQRPLIVILTADHGQSLGEHGTFGHGFLLWQPVLHVPMIIGATAVPNPSPRVSNRVSLLDLHSTILDMAGIEDQGSTFGLSLWPAVTHGKAAERTLFAEVRVLAKNQSHSPLDAAAVAVFDGSSKLIWRPDGLQFYNLGEDPDETHGVTETAGERQREMIRMAETFTTDVEAVTDWESLDPEALQELRALGYLD